MANTSMVAPKVATGPFPLTEQRISSADSTRALAYAARSRAARARSAGTHGVCRGRLVHRSGLQPLLNVPGPVPVGLPYPVPDRTLSGGVQVVQAADTDPEPRSQLRGRRPLLQRSHPLASRYTRHNRPPILYEYKHIYLRIAELRFPHSPASSTCDITAGRTGHDVQVRRNSQRLFCYTLVTLCRISRENSSRVWGRGAGGPGGAPAGPASEAHHGHSGHTAGT